MCLYNLKDFKYNKDYGYKVVTKTGKKYFSQIQHTRLFKSKWVEAERELIVCSNGFSSYTSGFHIFTSISSCKRWGLSNNDVIVKVKFKGKITKGSQGYGSPSCRTVVAEYIRILEEV